MERKICGRISNTVLRIFRIMPAKERPRTRAVFPVNVFHAGSAFLIS